MINCRLRFWDTCHLNLTVNRCVWIELTNTVKTDLYKDALFRNTRFFSKLEYVLVNEQFQEFERK